MNRFEEVYDFSMLLVWAHIINKYIQDKGKIIIKDISVDDMYYIIGHIAIENK